MKIKVENQMNNSGTPYNESEAKKAFQAYCEAKGRNTGNDREAQKEQIKALWNEFLRVCPSVPSIM